MFVRKRIATAILVWSRICKTYTINNNSIYLNIFTSWIIRYCIYISLINCGVLYYFILLFQINLPFKQCTVSISSYGVINFMTIRWRNKSTEIVSIHMFRFLDLESSSCVTYLKCHYVSLIICGSQMYIIPLYICQLQKKKVSEQISWHILIQHDYKYRNKNMKTKKK